MPSNRTVLALTLALGFIAVVMLVFILNQAADTTDNAHGVTHAPAPRDYTVASYAAGEQARCIKQKGFGEWRGSMGIDLNSFCEAYGNARALQAHRQQHPEQY